MSPYDFLWWGGAGVLIVAELLTGTFYLLMIAFGFIAAALAQLAGAGVAWQCVAAAFVALGALFALKRSRLGRSKQGRDTSANPDVNLDIGETLEVESWREGRARVPYRGAEWDVELAPGARADAHFYEVAAVQANRLIVVEKKPASARPHHRVSTKKE
ncbi:MAG TPA: NfeD family protein [Trinickia sp.]|jgi:membrane protein implicated in regulation of membrane protease activity|uniref:NfeD family protein n=1 Tax=Trinickia sp. TaxID=2571163 RepID=UPI002BDB2E32|nr:NfeD family protein [Trinickia sp.]HTI17689.1 NfeD family protein [Trinickia sp.]